MRDILHFPCVLAFYLVEVQQDVIGPFFSEFFDITMEGGSEGRWGGEGALFGELRHSSLELEEEGRVEVDFRGGAGMLHVVNLGNRRITKMRVQVIFFRFLAVEIPN